MFFRKGLEPRRFHYEPWFYDPEKEEFEKRVKEAREHYHGERDENYKASSASFNFKNRKNHHVDRDSRYQTNYGKVNPMRLISLIALLCALVYFLFF